MRGSGGEAASCVRARAGKRQSADIGAAAAQTVHGEAALDSGRSSGESSLHQQGDGRLPSGSDAVACFRGEIF